MKRLSILLLLFVFQTAASCEERPEVKLVQAYLEARVATMQLDSSVKDVDKVLAFCADDFVYEHPAAKARIAGKDNVRAGMTGYLGLTRNTTYSFQLLSSNRDVVIGKVDMKFTAKEDDGTWKPGARSNITVFEIENGKIKRILDY
jgi:ketosteroid isomerase-like protein